MRLKLASAFAVGFAAGLLTLAIALWSAGQFHRTTAASPSAAITTSSEPAPDVVRQSPPPRVQTPVPDPVALDHKSALHMPISGVDPSSLVSNFTEQRGAHPHEALDIMSPRGTPVMAVDEGNVAKLFTSKEGGLTVYQFDDSRTLCYYYAHLDHYAAGLKEGTLLRPGDVLGYVGSTGNASPSAPHLHFAVFRLGPEKEWWKGTAIDPLPLLQGK